MAAGSTYTPIYSTTLSSAQSSVTLNSFSGYTDLILVGSLLGSAGGYYPRIRINGDTGSTYSYTYMTGNGSTATSGRAPNVSSSAYITGNAQLDASTPMVIETHINNYSNSTTYKTLLTRASQAGTGVDAAVTLWRNTAAITSLEINANGGNFNVGSTFTLYGITAA